MGVLEDFIVFLGKLDAGTRESMKISGVLMQDDDGHYFCGNAIVDPRFFKYKGCSIMSTQVIINKDDTANQYPYYCYGLEDVEVSYSGKIQMKNEKLYCNNLTLPDFFSKMMGKTICINKIGVNLHKKDPNRLLVKIKEWHPLYPAIEGVNPTVNVNKPCRLEKDSSGFLHIGNISVSPFDSKLHTGDIIKNKLHPGDMIKIRKAMINKDTRTNTKYPLLAVSIVKIEE